MFGWSEEGYYGKDEAVVTYVPCVIIEKQLSFGERFSSPLIPTLTFMLPNEILGHTGHLKTEIAREMTVKPQ